MRPVHHGQFRLVRIFLHLLWRGMRYVRVRSDLDELLGRELGVQLPTQRRKLR